MRSLKTYLVAALAFASLSATAQTKKVVDRVDQRTVQELDHQDVTTKFKSPLGEAKFKDLISPNVQLGIGYQFNPWFAARIQGNGWQSKGGWNSYAQHPFTYTYKWNYVAPGLDLMFDMTNLIGGWNPNRFLSVVLFVGGGANIAWKNDEANAIAANVQQLDGYKLEYLWDGTKVRPFGRGGLQLGFRLSDAVSLLLEGNANILGDTSTTLRRLTTPTGTSTHWPVCASTWVRPALLRPRTYIATWLSMTPSTSTSRSLLSRRRSRFVAMCSSPSTLP